MARAFAPPGRLKWQLSAALGRLDERLLRARSVGIGRSQAFDVNPATTARGHHQRPVAVAGEDPDAFALLDRIEDGRGDLRR